MGSNKPWRPARWTNPYKVDKGLQPLDNPFYEKVFEAGADAMLQAVKDRGHWGYMPGEGTGWHCFIPEEKEVE